MDPFSPHSGFLDQTLKQDLWDFNVKHIRLNNLEVTLTAQGVITCSPLDLETKQSQDRIILSAGIHGNETAPIELLDQIVREIVAGEVLPKRPVLFILGNPPAMISQSRDIEENLNRLFFNAKAGNPAKSIESARANELMEIVRKFATNSKVVWHYDLHTAIRSSAIEKFALYPFVENRSCPSQQLKNLADSDVTALLLQNKASPTFSGWTSSEFRAESFTIELGKVAPFGKNNLAHLENLKQTLIEVMTSRDLIEKPQTAQTAQTENNTSIQQFKVVHEIINTGHNFKLHIPENAANFTRYDIGSLIWSDTHQEYRITNKPLYIVFPNSKVAKGQRAGLLVGKVD